MIKKGLNFKIFAILLIILASFSNLYIFSRRLTETRKNRWIYLSTAEGRLIEYLRDHGENGEGVLADYQIANVIPANTNKRVWVGHKFQSPDFYKRAKKLNQFYTGELKEKEAKDFIQETGVSWILGRKGLYSSILQPEVQVEKFVLYKVNR